MRAAQRSDMVREQSLGVELSRQYVITARAAYLVREVYGETDAGENECVICMTELKVHWMSMNHSFPTGFWAFLDLVLEDTPLLCFPRLYLNMPLSAIVPELGEFVILPQIPKSLSLHHLDGDNCFPPNFLAVDLHGRVQANPSTVALSCTHLSCGCFREISSKNEQDQDILSFDHRIWTCSLAGISVEVFGRLFQATHVQITFFLMCRT